MKKILGIVVLGLLLTFNVSAEKVAKTLNQSVHFCDNRSTGDSQGSSRLNNYQISFSKNCNTNKGSSKITEKEFIIGMLDLKKNTKQDKFLNRRIDNLFSYYEASNLNTNKIQNTPLHCAAYRVIHAWRLSVRIGILSSSWRQIPHRMGVISPLPVQ